MPIPKYLIVGLAVAVLVVIVAGIAPLLGF
jgi:hypothetical protein